MKILFLGDIVGKAGCTAVIDNLPEQIRKNKIDFVVANGENAADDGFGITKKITNDLLESGVDVITTGNHVWDRKETTSFIENENRQDKFISDHKDSFLETISTDWKPVIEVVFNKIRNKNQKPNQVIELEQFISIKGVKAIGNQLTSDKVKQINTLESIAYKPPAEVPADEIEVVDEKVIDDDIGQTTLF